MRERIEGLARAKSTRGRHIATVAVAAESAIFEVVRLVMNEARLKEGFKLRGGEDDADDKGYVT